MATIEEKNTYTYANNKYDYTILEGKILTSANAKTMQEHKPTLEVAADFSRKLIGGINRLLCNKNGGFNLHDTCCPGGLAVSTNGLKYLPAPGYRIHVDKLLWVTPVESQYFVGPEPSAPKNSIFHNGLLNSSGQFFEASLTTNIEKANCRMMLTAGALVMAVFIKPINFGDIIWLFVDQVPLVIDEMKHAHLCDLVERMFTLEMEVLLPNEQEALKRLNELRLHMEAFLNDMTSFLGLRKYLENDKSDSNHTRNAILADCMSTIDYRRFIEFNTNVPVEYSKIRFPRNHLVFSCVSDPHHFQDGSHWSESNNLMFHNDYILRQKQFRELKVFFVIRDDNLHAQFGDNAQYLGQLPKSEAVVDLMSL